MVKENGMIMMSEEEFAKLNEKNDILKSAVIKMLKQLKANTTEDAELTPYEFLAVYNAAVEKMFETYDDDNEIYGHDVTVHWHGLYCNCQDGATVTNTVIDGLEECAKEIDW